MKYKLLKEIDNKSVSISVWETFITDDDIFQLENWKTLSNEWLEEQWYIEKILEDIEWKKLTMFYHTDKYDAEEQLIEEWLDKELANKLRRVFEEIEIEYKIENWEIKFLNII